MSFEMQGFKSVWLQLFWLLLFLGGVKSFSPCFPPLQCTAQVTHPQCVLSLTGCSRGEHMQGLPPPVCPKVLTCAPSFVQGMFSSVLWSGEIIKYSDSKGHHNCFAELQQRVKHLLWAGNWVNYVLVSCLE